MSALRDIRLLVARHLDLPINTKACVLDVMNILDTSLDAEGYEPPTELTAALRRLDHVVIFGDDLSFESTDALDVDEDDIVDINIFDADDDDDDEDS